MLVLVVTAEADPLGEIVLLFDIALADIAVSVVYLIVIIPSVDHMLVLKISAFANSVLIKEVFGVSVFLADIAVPLVSLCVYISEN